ncbi:hypothetical protein [Rhodovibrio sodomensis]|uniref:Mom family adenine methylcarbamoylation protein n=1 Tax=Rhodovibrio sodomensis TaxID=1088 RepID=UPI001905135A|nr:hypothetical protein [Rhodovibrio sodomensis]
MPLSESDAKAFVGQHHYSHSYPAARFRAGLVSHHWGRRARLEGVAVFSQPMNQLAGPRHAGLPPARVVELGRFVLLDETAANAETFFLARAFAELRVALPKVGACLAYSDPVPRASLGGEIVFPGHYGCIYQAASGGAYLGRATARTLLLTPDGRVVSARTLSKLRNDERGAAYAYRQLRDAGAPARRPGEDGAAYLDRALADGGFRRQRHPGNHLYLFPVGGPAARRRLAREIGRGHPYPKGVDRPYVEC